MSLVRRILKKIARRFRRKGVVATRINRPGRNFEPLTAVDLWRKRFAYRETPAARAGSKRRMARERGERAAR